MIISWLHRFFPLGRPTTIRIEAVDHATHSGRPRTTTTDPLVKVNKGYVSWCWYRRTYILYIIYVWLYMYIYIDKCMYKYVFIYIACIYIHICICHINEISGRINCSTIQVGWWLPALRCQTWKGPLGNPHISNRGLWQRKSSNQIWHFPAKHVWLRVD